MESQRLSGMYRQAVEQVLWLISQFFDPPRIIMITGNAQSPYAARALIAGRQQISASEDMHPAYRVNLQIRRRNPLRVEAENQLILKLYEMSAAAGAPMPIESVLELLQVDGKERILPRIREATEQQRVAQAAVEAAQAATEDAQRSREQLEGVKQSLMENAKAQAGSDPTQGIYG